MQVRIDTKVAQRIIKDLIEQQGEGLLSDESVDPEAAETLAENIVDRLIERSINEEVAQLRQILKTLVGIYVQNRTIVNPYGDFVSCVTPDGIPGYWKDAIDALKGNNK